MDGIEYCVGDMAESAVSVIQRLYIHNFPDTTAEQRHLKLLLSRRFKSESWKIVNESVNILDTGAITPDNGKNIN